MEKIIEQLIKDSPELDELCKKGTESLSGGLFQTTLEHFAELIFDEVIIELEKEKGKRFQLNPPDDWVNMVGWSSRARMAIQACIDDIRRMKKITNI